MKLYIIRHGDPDYANDCLTPLGKRQAEALGRRFANTDLDMVFISPLGRAQETAKPTCEIKKLHAEILDWTSENAIYEELMVPEGNTSRWCFAQQNTNYKNNETIRYYDNWQKAHPDFDRVSAFLCQKTECSLGTIFVPQRPPSLNFITESPEC